MDCRNIRKKIPLYVDGILSPNPKELNFIEEHLQGCDRCKKEYTTYSRLINELNKMRECPLPSEKEWESIHDSIMRAISTEKERKIISLPLWRVTSSYYRIRAVAALILLSFISFIGFIAFYKTFRYQKIVAEVVEVEGKAVATVGVDEVIKPQSKILPGKIIITDENASINLKIEKSVVKIGKSSQIRLANLESEKTELELWEGNVNALVSKRKSNQLFRIKTPNAICEVVGTKFNVSTQYDCFHKKYITTLTVDEGIVKFGQEGNKLEVGAGKGIALFGDSLGSIVEKNDPIIEQLLNLKGKGYIYLSSLPESAKVFINNEMVGYTPIKIIKPFGIYEVSCAKDGFETQVLNIEVKPEKVNNVKFTLERKKKGLSILALQKELLSDSLYRIASEEMSNGRFENALHLLQQVTKNKNCSKELRSASMGKILICYKNLGKYSDFIATVDEILKGDYPTTQKANVLFERATVYRNILSEPDKAIKDLKAYLGNYSDGIWAEEASSLLAETYLALRKYKEAALEYENFCTKYKENRRREYVLYKLATIYANSLGETSKALEFYNRLMLEFPNSKYMEDIIFGSADCLLRSGNTTKAIIEFNNYLKKYPEGKWAAEARLRLSKIQTAKAK